MSVVGVVVGSDKITLVEGKPNKDGIITLIKDEVFNLEAGDRHHAYSVMHRRIIDRLSSDVSKIVLKASSASKFTGNQASLHAAELRGVFLSAIPNGLEVLQLHKKSVSQNYGSRKLEEYTKDDIWWEKNFDGKCRKGSREAAFLIIAGQED
ncbi:hypothetical protein [Azospirillum sp.]|uniref:hypothetical protein n=1 Tax=Azospirillum sp. TaxID=34012 RepID=UPI00263280D2|nr:hypothetical protein [Azospirillum sp.]